jgi:hypothetical protein
MYYSAMTAHVRANLADSSCVESAADTSYTLGKPQIAQKRAVFFIAD